MRLNMRREADTNKAKVMATLEALKAKGEIKPSMLKRFGINPDRFSNRSMLDGVSQHSPEPDVSSRRQFEFGDNTGTNSQGE